MRIALSSGHGLHIRGAAGSPIPPQCDEVTEVRKIVEAVATKLRRRKVGVETFHDDVSTTQSANLSAIVTWHNARERDLDCSIHLNAFDHHANGVECLYLTQKVLAREVSKAIAMAGTFKDRGPKYRPELTFLNSTEMPAILIETFFCDHTGDCIKYREHHDEIAEAIAFALAPDATTEWPEPPVPVRPGEFPSNQTYIKCSVFGGGDDPNDSAYPPYDFITDTELSCALPWRFSEPRPTVLVHNIGTGKDAVCTIRDIGPWLIDDNYWETGERPLAETCFLNQTPLPRGPNAGKIPNGAGLDVTPGAAAAIGLEGMGQVNWRFIGEDEPVA